MATSLRSETEMSVVASIAEQLGRAIAMRQQVRLAREAIGAANVHGFPLEVSDQLVLLAQVEDWRLDGYTLVRLGDVSEVRSGELERFSERVLEGEGELARLGPPSPPVPMASW